MHSMQSNSFVVVHPEYLRATQGDSVMPDYQQLLSQRRPAWAVKKSPTGARLRYIKVQLGSYGCRCWDSASDARRLTVFNYR